MLKSLCLKKVTLKKKVNPKMWGKEEIGGKEIEKNEVARHQGDVTVTMMNEIHVGGNLTDVYYWVASAQVIWKWCCWGLCTREEKRTDSEARLPDYKSLLYHVLTVQSVSQFPQL